jgi:hypothetical protein
MRARIIKNSAKFGDFQEIWPVLDVFAVHTQSLDYRPDWVDDARAARLQIMFDDQDCHADFMVLGRACPQILIPATTAGKLNLVDA